MATFVARDLMKRKEGRDKVPASRQLMPPGGRGGMFAARTPDIDAGEQEQPDHVDEVPIPGSEFEAEMLRRRELALVGTDQADGEEDGADEDMRAMEAGRHEECGAVDVAFEAEGGVAVFVSLHAGEGDAEQDRQQQPL